MLRFVIKKIVNNRLMIGCLLAGFILAVAMVSSIPLYTSGILQRMLTSDLKMYQQQYNSFPGDYVIKADTRYLEPQERLAVYHTLKENLHSQLIGEIPLTPLAVTEIVTLDSYEILPAIQREEAPRGRYVSIASIDGMEDHITIKHGKSPGPRIVNNELEVIVTEKFLQNNDLFLGEVVDIKTRHNIPFERAVITGIFTIKDYTDPFWSHNIPLDGMFFDYTIFTRDILKKDLPLLVSAKWNVAFDYYGISIGNIGPILRALEGHHRLANRYSQFLDITVNAESILLNYSLREKQLRFVLWIINIPVLILICFYLFMVANQIITNEQNEIAVLKSRGKSSFEVFLIYFYMSLIISAIALAAGPPIGFLICRFMGASNGFLEFVRRAPLPISLNPPAYLYSVIVLCFLIITIIVPAFFRTKTSIVQLQQQRSGDRKQPLWKKFYVDLLILALAGYGLFRYTTQQNILEITGASSIDIGIDPLLFLTSTFFILGTGLLFLRLFPLLIRGIHYAGRKRWSPYMYCALLEVGRAGRRGQFLMLFLIFSIAIGICNANMARTLNRNIEDRVRYTTGADITLKPLWQKEITQASLVGSDTAPSFARDRVADIQTSIHFREPSFIPYTELDGAEKATKVLVKENGKALIQKNLITNIKLMGIVPHEFGGVAWFREDLLPSHINNYLNLLSDSPSAILVSENFRTMHKCKPGDTISFSWGGQGYIQGTIYAFIKYWPGYNPLEKTDFNNSLHLIVANLSYLQNKLALDPYTIWIRKNEGTPDQALYADIEKKDLDIEELSSVSQDIIKQKNDPFLKGINGALTQGFILIMLVCTIGFLLYWMLSLRQRILQFGILRAMGLSRNNLMRIILLEQLLMSGIAIFMGILIGGIASRLFVPFLQLVFSSENQVPPFLVIASRSDYIRIYFIIFFMLSSGFLILGYFMKRLKIGRALKLGED